MSEDVSINKFFDEAMMVELAQQAADLHQQMLWSEFNSDFSACVPQLEV
jgi:hypothetical protein